MLLISIQHVDEVDVWLQGDFGTWDSIYICYQGIGVRIGWVRRGFDCKGRISSCVVGCVGKLTWFIGVGLGVCMVVVVFCMGVGCASSSVIVA